MHGLLYLIACLVVPALWGLVASWVYDSISAHRTQRRPCDEDSADMYHI